MKKEQKNILLICYSFPPYPGIGGRRWAKLAKYLAKEGIKVHVICAENPFKQKSLWTRDVEHKNISVHSLPPRYPRILSQVPENLLGKISYKLSKMYCTWFSRGTPYDKSLFWKAALLKTSEELLKKYAISNVIVTGAPFRNLFYATQLKKKFPDINLIADFRDPWTQGSSYGFESLNSRRFQYEFALEKQVCEAAEYVTAPNNLILEYLSEKHKINAGKLKVLAHGYDVDDIPAVSTTVRKSKKRFIFFGTLYEGAEYYFQLFMQAVESFVVKYPAKKNDFKIDFYSWSESIKKLDIPHLIKNNIHFHNPALPKELFSEISDSDYVVTFYTEKYKDYLSTKFIELLPLKKPVIYFGPHGLITDFLVSRNIGIAVTETNAEEIITECILNEKTNSFATENHAEYSYSYLAGKLIDILR